MSKYHRVLFFETQTVKSLLLLLKPRNCMVLSQLKKLTYWIENGIRSLCAKIISECCELVKLCHINRSGPVFLRHSVELKWIYFVLSNFICQRPWRYVNEILAFKTCITCLDWSFRRSTALLFGQQPWQTAEALRGNHAAAAWQALSGHARSSAESILPEGVHQRRLPVSFLSFV